MPLIKSISGFRGTIGGRPGDNLTPQDIVECTAAFGQWVLDNTGNPNIVVGRDGRISGEIASALVVNTLRSMGISVVDLGLSTTPTVEIAVPLENAGGGIILTASHNPPSYNGYKLKGIHGGPLIPSKVQEVEDMIPDQHGLDLASIDLTKAEKLIGWTPQSQRLV